MKDVPLESIGICEHCERLVTMEELPAEAMSAIWRCPYCNGELSHCSFGYDTGSIGAKRVRWVGPDGKWTDQMPKKEFTLGTWCVLPPL